MADALSLINECIRTQNPYLDLGCCGLTDELVAEGTAIDIALRQCTHLKTLILSNKWLDREKNEWINSQNTDTNNHFTTHPPVLPLLRGLEVLRCGGEWASARKRNWEIKDMDFVSSLKFLILLDISSNQITELKGLENMTALQYFYISDNQITELKGLENLTALQYFDIFDNKITELKGLENLTDLQYFRIVNNQITELKGLENLTALQSFYISDNQITELKGLENLTALQSFDIRKNQITELKGLKNLTALQFFGIQYNEITELKGLENLTTLQYFYIQYNEITELKGLENMTALQSFEISHNQITELKGLENLTALQSFYIYSNQITELKGLENLTALQSFDISDNKITEVKGLENLTALQSFYISDNKITEVKGLENLTALQSFYISRNQITELKGLENLTALQSFYISDNKITELKGLENLTALQSFNIRNNQITELKGLENLTALQSFYISRNQITDIRPLKPFMERAKKPLQVVWKEWYEASKGEIAVKENPLESPPAEIVQQGNAAILAWFEANKEYFKEVKVLLIGDAKTGKTSLLRLLKEDIYKPDEEQTDGILIEPFSFKELATFQDYPSLHEAKAYFWDFGGQEVMSATHQFFMTKRSVYLVLLEARKDKKADEQLRELMEQVENFGGNSQVIVVVNKIDLNRGFSLDSQVLQKDYPQIKAILYISCKDKENINAVKQALAEAIPQAELYETQIDVRWKAIKEELQQQTNQAHYLSETNFMQVCEKHKLSKASEQLSAITFLHDLGILLHFEELKLGEYFVLEPYWVTTGVYQILTSPFAQGKKGEIHENDLKFIINDEEDKVGAYCTQKRIRYSTNEVRFIADIMTQFRLAYYTSNGKTLLIPDLFENNTPLAETDLFTEATDALRLVYDYSYLPKSIMPRFMVEMQRDIRLAWRTGVILHCKQRNNTEALVMVREKQVSITIKGDFMQKREYLSVIRFFLDKINENLNLKPTLLIPLPNYKGQFVKYEILRKMERAGETTYMNWEVEKEFLISSLLEGIERKEVIDRQGNTYITNYITNVKGNDTFLVQHTKDTKIDYHKEVPQNLQKTLDDILAQIGFESQSIKTAISQSSEKQLKVMDEMLQDISKMSNETQNQLWDGFCALNIKNDKLKNLIEGEIAAAKIDEKDRSSLKLKIAIPPLLGIGLEYEMTLVDGNAFSEWAKSWRNKLL